MQHKIAEEFDNIIEEACVTQLVMPIDFLEEVAGADNYEERISPRQAIQLYDENEDDCVGWLNYLVNDCGLEPLEFATLRDWDYILNDETGRFVITDTDKNKTFIVNDMFANYCDELLGILTK